MRGSLHSIHDTGVRPAGYEASLTSLREELKRRNTTIDVQGFLWGGMQGGRISDDLVDKVLPPVKIPDEREIGRSCNELSLGAFVLQIYRIIIPALCIGLVTERGLASEGVSQSAGDAPIQIVAAMYGVPGAKHVLDITQKLQDLCGAAAQRCSVFCSDSSFGRYRLGAKPICRVTYRCGAEDVRSVEAWREEPILMRCAERRSERQDGQVQPVPPSTN